MAPRPALYGGGCNHLQAFTGKKSLARQLQGGDAGARKGDADVVKPTDCGEGRSITLVAGQCRRGDSLTAMRRARSQRLLVV